MDAGSISPMRTTAWILVPVLSSCTAPRTPLDQPAPSAAPALFAPGLVSTSESVELNGALAPDGREFFFARRIDGVAQLHRSRLVDGKWTTPELLFPYAGGARALAVDMSYSPDGRRLYFLGTDPDRAGPGAPLDLWYIERDGDGWSNATRLPEPLSTAADEIYPCTVADGSLYFTSNRPGGLGKSDVWRAQYLGDGRFAAPVNVGARINSEHSEGDTWVDPDERVLVFSSSRPGGYGQGDLYASFRAEDGEWSKPVNLGPTINTAEVEYCPMGTWDGRWFFYSRRDAPWDSVRTGDVYWIDASVLQRYRR